MNGNVNAGTAGTGTAASSPETAGFCQHCGKTLDEASRRVVGDAVFCEPCLAARVNGTAYGPGPGAAGWGLPRSRPNPRLAALLGLIPGVGAIYNEQYAKGFVHLAVFAVLVSLADASDIFAIFVVGWVFYMAIEAYHTARARLEGTPLPNPFGLNDLGERLGFGRAWPAPPAGGAANTPPAGTGVPPAGSGGAAQGGFGPQTSGGWGAPVDAQAVQEFARRTAEQARADGADGFGQGYGSVPPYGAVAPYGAAAQYGAGSPYGAVPPAETVPPVGAAQPWAPIAGYGGVPPVEFLERQRRFPVGAVWLIGLGSLFMLATTGIFHGFSGETLVGLGLIGLAVWIFLRRMMDTGVGLRNDGSGLYVVRLMGALRASVWVGLVGALMLLDEFRILGWGRSWPLFIIVAGVMLLLERAASQARMNAPVQPFDVPVNAPVSASAGPFEAVTPVESTESETHEEGRL